MAAPKISVLIPTYNYARFLPEALDSVLAQDFQDFELLVSDDQSTDESRDVLARYAAKDARVRAVDQTKRLGMTGNWNWCLAQARGEYIKFLFGDDKLASPQALGKLAALLDTNPRATLAASARLVLDDQSRVLETWDAFAQPGAHRGTDVILRCLEENANLIGEPSSVMFRRNAIGRGFSHDYRQLVDLEMWFALLEAGDFAFTSEPLGAFRRHAAQQTEVNKTNNLANSEHARLYWQYHRKPYLKALASREALFRKLYLLKKDDISHPDSARVARDLRDEIGTFWYPFYWLRYKITRPFENLFRALGKRSRR